MMIRKTTMMRSWNASSHLQRDYKEDEEKRVGMSRPTSNFIMIRRKRVKRSASPHLQHDDKEDDDDEEEEEEEQEECFVPPPVC